MRAQKTQFVSINATASSASAKRDSKRKKANAFQNAMRINAKEIHMHAGRTQNARISAKGIDANAWMDMFMMRIR